MTTSAAWSVLSAELKGALHLAQEPIAITFGQTPPAGVDPFNDPIPEPTADGRTGRVPAGCVFWVKAADQTFSTVPEDHGNCSVGSLTHGLKTLEEAAGNADVATLVEAGWVTEDMFPRIPVVAERHEYITYGPLHESPVEPDVVLIRVNGRQLMVINDAVPDMHMEGKPQCHIVAMAKNGEVAASVGCALSRARTGFGPEEMSCAIPGSRLTEVADAIARTASVDSGVAKYAAEDSRRFQPA